MAPLNWIDEPIEVSVLPLPLYIPAGAEVRLDGVLTRLLCDAAIGDVMVLVAIRPGLEPSSRPMLLSANSQARYDIPIWGIRHIPVRGFLDEYEAEFVDVTEFGGGIVSDVQVNEFSPYREARPTACNGCENYHGRSYGGNMLICAIYPSGVEGDRCPSWQGLTQSHNPSHE